MVLPVRTVAPASLPVSVEDAKFHCRVDHDDEDDLITALIQAATDYLDGIDGILGRAIVTQTWRQDFTAFEGELRLPLKPVASVTSVTYYDGDNAQQTLSTDVYELLNDERGPYVALKTSQSWPSVYNRTGAISVTFVAGVTVASVPAPIRISILMMVDHWYNNRSAVSGVAMSEVPLSVDALIRPYRQISL